MKAIDESKTISVTNDRYRLKYHVMTPFGWMNDPNGFSYFNGYYHFFTNTIRIAPSGAPCTGALPQP
ncbi:MAG: hypothetical protein J6575_02315 [Bifidobacterium sp.]|nr:hypothetical protein [Bifidobacterium sp.]